MAGFTEAPLIKVLAVPGVSLLIAFLGYFSQLLFNLSSLEPGPLSRDETVVFNAMLATLYVAYFRAVMTDPGNYAASFDSPGGANGKGNGAGFGIGAGNTRGVVIDLDESAGGRWCAKCSAPKPRRAHHCRHCGRCVPKMDHHCPWTANCVSMTTFPHFLRFLLWANLSLWALGYLAGARLAALWRDRDLPSYLGPSLPALAGLAVVCLVGSVTALALFIMLVNTVKGWLFNQTMIEGWEMDRHEALLSRRHGRRGWWDDDDGAAGQGKPLERVEFPYDVGLWENMCQAMGSRNPLWWPVPLAGNPRVGAGGKGPGWEWEENGFNREPGMWPPPDPEKARRAGRSWPASRRDFAAELRDVDAADGGDAREAFRKRQEADQLRRRRTAARKLVAELEEEEEDDDYGSDDYDHDDIDDDDDGGYKRRMPPPGPWVNSDGETLHDYGVDEDAEAEDGLELLPDGDYNDNYDDDDVPLAELMRRRKARKA